MLAQRSGNLLGNLRDVAEIQAAGGQGGRAYADDADRRGRDSFRGISGGAKSAFLTCNPQQIIEFWFHYRRTPLIEGGDLGIMNIDADDFMPNLRQTTGGDCADIAKSKN